MEWNQLFLEKEDWQRKTFDSIKNDLISARNNRFIRYDNAAENYLVMIYGKSQVGKTTLILSMIGVKPECFSNVYETLRAGVPRGNSSTSTAIIYSKSINEKYGCVLTSVNDLSAKEVSYFDESGMIECLQNIREDVENNSINTDSILFIYIPGNCFVEDSSANSISIMDMPGIESRNHREDVHVQNLMTKYIPISSVCIIACRSNDIQSLETTVLPNQMDWKRMTHRFILVVTHAYNDGTTKQYFKTERSERKKSFYEYVRETYTGEIRKILGRHNRTEVYPVDVGDALVRLCNEEIKNNVDREEIIDTKNRILSDIRKSIVNHKGERLKSALEDLKIVIKHYGEDKLERIAEDISDFSGKIEDRNRLIDRTQKYVEQLRSVDGGQAEIEREIACLSTVKAQVSQLLFKCISNLSNRTKVFITVMTLYQRSDGADYLKDSEQAVLNYLRTDISNKIEQYIKELTDLIGQADIVIDFNISEIIGKADSECILVEQNKLYPPKNGLFSRREKVFMVSVESVCNTIQVNINKMLNGYVNMCILEIDKNIIQKNSKLNFIKRSISLQNNKICKYHSEINSFRQEKENLCLQREEIKQRRRQDQKTLAMYLEYAKRAYLEQREEIIRKINECKIADDKMMLILFLGLLDKDYQKVTGGTYENSHQYTVAKRSQRVAQ